MKTCGQCKKTKNRAEFNISKQNATGLQSGCRDCSKKRAKRYRELDPFQDKNYTLKWKYGITYGQYCEMYKNQRGLCAICQVPETSKSNMGRDKKLAIDHCRISGKIRGVLCTRCNTQLGHFEKRIEEFNNYLKRTANE